jgi:hypothetical protein
VDAVHWVQLDGRLGADRAGHSGRPPVSPPRLRQTVHPNSFNLLRCMTGLAGLTAIAATGLADTWIALSCLTTGEGRSWGKESFFNPNSFERPTRYRAGYRADRCRHPCLVE